MTPSAEVRAKKRLAATLRMIRGARMMTQKGLAEAMDCHPTYVSHVEAGRKNPSLSWLARAADALDVEVVDLFSDVDISFVRRETT